MIGNENRGIALLIVVAHIGTVLLAVCYPFSLPSNANFWLFSTISQSIAALFGFTFAGYAFFRSEATLDDMDDPEADEILNRLHSKAHNRLINSSIPSGLAIIGGLCVITLTKMDTAPGLGDISQIVLSTGTFTFYQAILAVVFSMMFVINVSRPNRAHRVVEEILNEESMTGRDVDIGEFVKLFIELEEILRKIYYDYNGTRERISAGQIIEYLSNTNALENVDVDMLREITRYRNLVVHGEIESVDSGVMNELQEATDEVNKLHEEIQSQAEPE